MELQRVLVILSMCRLYFGQEMTESSVIGDAGMEIPINYNGGHNSGGLIGGVIGVIVAVAVTIFCVIYWCRRRRHRQQPESADLQEVVVLIPDVPEIVISEDKPEVEISHKEEIPQQHIGILTVLKKTTEQTVSHIKNITKKSNVVDAQGRIRDPVPITLQEKKREILKKKRFWRFRSWLKIRKEKTRTRSQIKREREEKSKEVRLWLNRRRERIKIKEEKNLKIRRKRSWLCCG
ncbi:uncharacterized protein [Dendropsophus ebraccatus]|uniref:uncharacterized protein n=1 Tax=Dendropsophus ebraccatus TaxID=150705 RepID=UPI003831D6BE